MSFQSVRAADACRVSADTSQIEILDEGICLVPLMLYGNHGLMGFRISFSYDVEQIEILTVSRGTLTAAGNFMSNIAEKEADGKLELLWNDTEEKKTDGSLCYLGVRSTAENPEIAITYSQPDTFNEAYQDVRLACETIRLNNIEPSALAGQGNPAGSDESEDVRKAELRQRDNAIKEYRDVQLEKRETEDKIKEAYLYSIKKYGVKTYQELSKKEQENFWEDTREYLMRDKGADKGNLGEIDVKNQVERLGIAEQEYCRAGQKEKSSGSGILWHFLLPGGIITAGVFSFALVVWVRRKRRFHKNGEDQ